MATPIGIIGFQGTIGGISFYMRKGKPCARKAGGPSKEKIAASKNCQRTRENNAEFKGAVAASKLLRTGLRSFTRDFSDGNLSWRLNGVFKNMIEQAHGTRGERPVEILSNKYLLVDFNLNKEVSFDRIFKAKFTFSDNASRNEITLSIPDFDTTKFIHAPAGATHFRMVNAIVVVPKLLYDPLIKNYLRKDGLSGVLKADTFSDYIPLRGNVGSDTTIISTIAESPIISLDSSVISCIGIQFYQEEEGEQYKLQSSSAMKISEIY